MPKTSILGYNMEKRAKRRRLVMVVYTVIAALLLGAWLLDRLQETAFYLIFAVSIINWKILGGYGPQGLVKPFNGKGPRNRTEPSSLAELGLNAGRSLSFAASSEYRNDERELQRRDRVHYQAYQGICGLLAVVWLLAHWQVHPPHFIPAALLPVLLDGLMLPAMLVAVTLPQAILLWTEPDMELEADDEPAAAALPSAR